MTETLDTAPTAPAGRPRIVTRPLLLRFVSLVGASASFYLLLSVVPDYAASHAATRGGAGGAAGLATGALMLASVAGELATPALVRRLGYRGVLAVGLVLLGTPALVLTASTALWWTVAVCVLRGVGFAFCVVAGGAVTAALVPAERRGEGLALVGIVGGVPSVLGLPLGVWLAAHAGYATVCVIAGLAPIAAVLTVPGLPDRIGSGGQHLRLSQSLCTGELARPALVFASTALAAGVAVTFLPLAVPAAGTGVVTLALFVQPAATTLARWLTGRHGDRHGPAGLVLPGLLVASGGTLLMAATGSPALVVTGVLVFGTGFGIAQNSTLTLMYSRVPAAGYGTVSALWNFAYDAGMGSGALAFGRLAGVTGYPWALAATAALMVALALAPALTDRHTALRAGLPAATTTTTTTTEAPLQ